MSSASRRAKSAANQEAGLFPTRQSISVPVTLPIIPTRSTMVRGRMNSGA